MQFGGTGLKTWLAFLVGGCLGAWGGASWIRKDGGLASKTETETVVVGARPAQMTDLLKTDTLIPLQQKLAQYSIPQLKDALYRAIEDHEKQFVYSRFDLKIESDADLWSRAEEVYRSLRAMKDFSPFWMGWAKFRRGDGSEFQWKLFLEFYDMEGNPKAELRLSRVSARKVGWYLAGYPQVKDQVHWGRSAGLGNLSMRNGKTFFVGTFDQDDRASHLAIPLPQDSGTPVELLENSGKWVTGDAIEWTPISAQEYREARDRVAPPSL